jgi:hypothetical protein
MPSYSSIFPFAALPAVKIIKYQSKNTVSEKLDSTFASIKDDKNYRT